MWKKRKPDYRDTLRASYAGYVTQAIVNNLAPLLFLIFQETYGISLHQITLMITLNFGIQLLVDLLSAAAVDRVGYKKSIVFAHMVSAAGIGAMALLPGYRGLMVSVILYAVGGGLIEVLISPIVEACPTEEKSASMSLLHSFYCWGHVLVVLGTTLFFALAGRERWRLLCLMWAMVPACNAVKFARVPIRSLKEEGETLSWRKLLGGRLFWIFALLMVCSGASEQAMSQWASAFAESGLKVSKTAGDLAGPCLFAALMGSSRIFYARFSEKIPLKRFMLFSGGMCLTGYILAAYSQSPVLALAGCALCGLAVGILWPGTFSLAAAGIPGGSTAMFAFLALAGDLGCSAGPTIVGLVADACSNIQAGLLMAVLFPIMLFLGVLLTNIIGDGGEN
ncbi:MAG: MFS transporter [Hungatella sp.]|nr:MFS transporter [Hungatella sp.]